MYLEQFSAKVALQIARKYCFKKSLRVIVNDDNNTPRFEEFVQQNVFKRLKNYFKSETCTLISKEKKYIMTESERACLGFSPESYRFIKILIEG